MKVIQFVDPTGQTMVARDPRRGTAAIQLGSQVIVEESQEAVFFRDGKALDTFGPGRHTLATQNLPFLTKLIGVPFEGKSPFQAAVVFVSTKTFLDLKWGTKEPVVYRDAELDMVRLRAFGTYTLKAANSGGETRTGSATGRKRSFPTIAVAASAVSSAGLVGDSTQTIAGLRSPISPIFSTLVRSRYSIDTPNFAKT